jgi:hypothetical protein
MVPSFKVIGNFETIKTIEKSLNMKEILSWMKIIVKVLHVYYSYFV